MTESMTDLNRRTVAAPPVEGRGRAIIDSVQPQVDGGRFPCKRVAGDVVQVICDAFSDGHDLISCIILHKPVDESDWQEAPMLAMANDRWRGSFIVPAVGVHEFTVLAWVDHFKTWRHDLRRRDDERDIAVHLVEGAAMLLEAATQASSEHRTLLTRHAELIRSGPGSVMERRDLALDTQIFELMWLYANRELATCYEKILQIRVDDALAGFSAWYEFFPRSTVADAPAGEAGADDQTDSLRPVGRHGTFIDAIDRLPYIADLGFDIVYLPPVHPIGRVNRKGRNNQLIAMSDDVGVCWAIGSEEGGHKALLPELGTISEFRSLVSAAREQGLTLAMDIAFQCAPDHPYVREHPDWFKWRADGSVQFAENPPKKYQDIYPFDFECEDWQGLWQELKSVFMYWIEEGVRVFRVDNPHTKPFPFWEWVISELKRQKPDVIFLAEAFTRPRIMHRLAKLGFTQSYTYFTWRNTRAELEEYLLELSQGPGREYFRPNFWPNTPDILHETLQAGGLPAAALRYVLASTMSSNYGVYGPVFELGYAVPREAGSEEYLDSEKYQLRRWNLNSPGSLAPLMRTMNRIRRENPALQDTYNASLHSMDNEAMICFSKTTIAERSSTEPPTAVVRTDTVPSVLESGRVPTTSHNTLLVIVNLDPHNPRSGWTTLDMERLGLAHDASFEVVDLLDGTSYRWSGPHNFVALNPAITPAHVLLVRTVEGQ